MGVEFKGIQDNISAFKENFKQIKDQLKEMSKDVVLAISARDEVRLEIKNFEDLLAEYRASSIN